MTDNCSCDTPTMGYHPGPDPECPTHGDPEYKSIQEAAEEVIAQREAVPGMPSEGPYPSSVGEVADELADFIVELDNSSAPGLIVEMRDRLQRRIVWEIKDRLKYRPIR